MKKRLVNTRGLIEPSGVTKGKVYKVEKEFRSSITLTSTLVFYQIIQDNGDQRHLSSTRFEDVKEELSKYTEVI